MRKRKIKLIDGIESKQKVRKTFCLSKEAAEVYEKLSFDGKQITRFCSEHLDDLLLSLKDKAFKSQ